MSTDSTKKEALKLYKRSIKAMTEVHGKHPTPGLINNVAILYQKLGDMANAKKEFIKALKLSKEAYNTNGGISNGNDSTSSGGTSDAQADDDGNIHKYLQGDYLYDKSNITITFNVALYLKAAGDRVMAERLHLGIVEKFPGYGESYICLGQTYRERDMNEKAKNISQKPANSYEEAIVNKASIHLQIYVWKRAMLMEQRSFFRHFNKSQAKETYMLNYRWQTLNFKLRWIMRGESEKII